MKLRFDADLPYCLEEGGGSGVDPVSTISFYLSQFSSHHTFFPVLFKAISVETVKVCRYEFVNVRLIATYNATPTMAETIGRHFGIPLIGCERLAGYQVRISVIYSLQTFFVGRQQSR